MDKENKEISKKSGIPSMAEMTHLNRQEPVVKSLKKRSEMIVEAKEKDLKALNNNPKAMFKEIEKMNHELDFAKDNLKEKGAKINVNVERLFSQGERLPKQSLADYVKAYQELLDYVEKNTPLSLLKKEHGDKLTIERKGKMRGARNRWIPMQ